MAEQNAEQRGLPDDHGSGHAHENKATKIFSTSKDLNQFYSDRLEFLWGKYLTVVHLLISLAGATVLVFFNSIKISDVANYSGACYAVYAIIAAAAALVSAIMWRLLAQFFMEREVFGSSAETARYFRESRVFHVTSTYGEKRLSSLYRVAYAIAPATTILLLLTSWGFLVVFIIGNIPIAPA